MVSSSSFGLSECQVFESLVRESVYIISRVWSYIILITQPLSNPIVMKLKSPGETETHDYIY